MNNAKRKRKQGNKKLPSRGERLAAGSEGARSDPQRTGVNRSPRDAHEAPPGANRADAPAELPANLEVRPSKPTRRVFTKAYKLAILDEADACDQPGQIGELLRREGLYNSHLTQWRQARQRGELDPSVPSRRGPKPNPQAKQLAAELKKAKRREARLEEELRKARLIIEAQKKVAQLFDAIEQQQDENEQQDENR